MADAIPVQEPEVPAEVPVEIPKPPRKRVRLDEPEEAAEASFRAPGGAELPTHAATREDF